MLISKICSQTMGSKGGRAPLNTDGGGKTPKNSLIIAEAFALSYPMQQRVGLQQQVCNQVWVWSVLSHENKKKFVTIWPPFVRPGFPGRPNLIFTRPSCGGGCHGLAGSTQQKATGWLERPPPGWGPLQLKKKEFPDPPPGSSLLKSSPSSFNQLWAAAGVQSWLPHFCT